MMPTIFIFLALSNFAATWWTASQQNIAIDFSGAINKAWLLEGDTNPIDGNWQTGTPSDTLGVDRFWCIDWYTNNIGVLGTLEEPFLISNEYQMAGFARLVNHGISFAGDGYTATGTGAGASLRLAGLHFKLTRNLNFRYPHHREWTAIGGLGRAFEGHFDGGGMIITLSNEIRSVVNVDTSHLAFGLFGWIEGNATVRNFSLRGDVEFYGVPWNVIGNFRIGSAVGAVMQNAIVEHITSDVSINGQRISAAASPWIGGVVGVSGDDSQPAFRPTVRYVINHGNIYNFANSNVRIGGIAGESKGGSLLHDARNYGNIYNITGGGGGGSGAVGARVGGIAGHVWSPSGGTLRQFWNLINYGNITVASSGAATAAGAGSIRLGGIFGNVAQPTVLSNMINYGEISQTGTGASSATFIRATGGIVGFFAVGANSNSTIINSYNAGNISGHAATATTSPTGGIVGRQDGADTLWIVNVFNAGNILGHASHISQIHGNASSTTLANRPRLSDYYGISGGARLVNEGANSNRRRHGVFNEDFVLSIAATLNEAGADRRGLTLLDAMNAGRMDTLRDFAGSGTGLASAAERTRILTLMQNFALPWVSSATHTNLATIDFPQWEAP